MRRTKLDLKAIQSVAVAGLPGRARWMIRGTPLDFDFAEARRSPPKPAEARRGLRRITSRDFDGAIPDAWSDLLVFGGYDYAGGGGASPLIAVRQRDGAVCGLDVEREEDEAIFTFNSSVNRFVETFAALDQYLRRARRLPTDIETRVRDIDPQAYPVSEWRSLIGRLTAA